MTVVRTAALIVVGGLLAACEPRSAQQEAAQTPGSGQSVIAPDGVAIHFDDQGSGDIALIFVHGWNCDRSYWDAQREHFAHTYRVVTLDLAGHGDSAQNRPEWTMQAFGADVAAVADALKLTNIVLVGHSMGGKVVVEAGNQLKGRVIAVVGADTLHNGGRETPEPRASQLLAEMATDYAGFVNRLVTGMFVTGSDPKLRDWVLADMAAAPYAVARGARLASGGYDATPGIETLGVPLILISSDYRPTDKDHLTAAADVFEYREMPGIGHFVMLEDAQGFNGHLDAVLDSLAP